MSLTVTTESLENRQLLLNVEVDQARVDEQLRKAARKLAHDYRIPGFRKGKAPYHIIVQYLGEQNLYNEIIDELGQEIYVEALEQVDVEPYAQASLDDISFGPLTYKLIVPLEPTVDLGDYRNVRVEETPIEVDEEKVTAQLDSYLEEYAGWQDVTRESQYGDLMNIDVKSVIPAADAEGNEIVVLDETDWDVTPDEENPMEPDGFDAALLGLKAGEEKEFDLSWPEESQSIYAGKTAHFTVKVNSLQAYEKPELNDEFAQLVGPDYATLDDLLEDIRNGLREEAETAARNNYLEEALDAVLAQATLDFPPVVIEDQLDAMLRDYEQRLRQFGIEDLRGYFEQTGQDVDAFREGMREDAESIARRNLIVSELLRAEFILATDEDVEAKITEITGPVDEDDENAQAQKASMVEMFRNGPGRSLLESQILQEKTLDRLLAIVRGEELPTLAELEKAKLEAEEKAKAESALDDAAAEMPAETDSEEHAEKVAEEDSGVDAEPAADHTAAGGDSASVTEEMNEVMNEEMNEVADEKED